MARERSAMFSAPAAGDGEATVTVEGEDECFRHKRRKDGQSQRRGGGGGAATADAI